MTAEPETAEDVEQGLLEWVNYHLHKIGLKADNLSADLFDGFLLVMLVQVITKSELKGHESRVVATESITDPEDVKKNHLILRSWYGKQSPSSGDDAPSSDVSETPFGDLVKLIVWYLIRRNLPRKVEVGNTSSDRFRKANDIFNEISVPFPFSGFGLEEKGTLVLLRTIIILDKVNMMKNESKEGKPRKWVAPPQRYETNTPITEIIFEQCVLRVFLSSTFRDMQYERDRFFQHGAVELKRVAKSKGLELVFIDLRWGLTAEDSNDGWVVIRCLDSIGKCPYFVCSLGARYGWIPDQTDPKQWHPETNKRFPFLEEIPNLSVTEYEIQFAALIENAACSRVFFYFRDEEYAVQHAKNDAERRLFQSESEEAHQRQEQLKMKVREKFGAVTYRGPEQYSDLILSHLSYAMNEDFGNRQVRDPEDQAQHQFKMHRLAGFGGRKELLERIIEQVLDMFKGTDSNITVLAAESGIGKSSLMAATVRDLRALKDADMFVIYHFVGCTNLSNYVESISIRFWKMVLNSDEVFSNELRDNDESDFQKEGIQGLFNLIESKKLTKKYVFLIDAINQIYPSQETPVPHLLTWLPKKTPENVGLVVSTIDTHISCTVAKRFGLQVIPVSKLTNEEISEGTSAFLGRYDKKLSDVQMEMILGKSEDTGHPLYLRLVLDEIRVFGVYEKLDGELSTLLTCDGVIQLYSLIITRWEGKYNSQDAPIVETAMMVLYVSRIGLNEGDLDKYIQSCIGTNFNVAEWKPFFFTLVDSLFVRNGRYMYFHQLLLETIKNYFFSAPERKTETHKKFGMWLFGEYAEAEDTEEELVAEICHQLLNGECYDALVEYLKEETVVVHMLGGRYRYEFFNCWRTLNAKGIADYKLTYNTMSKSLTVAGQMITEFFLELYENSFLVSSILKRIAKRTTEESKADDFMVLGKVFKNIQNWKEAMYYFQKCLELELQIPNPTETLASIYEEIGIVCEKENRLEEALENFGRSLEIRRKLFGDGDLLVAQGRDRFGEVYLDQNKLAEASQEFQTAMHIRFKKVGSEHPLMASSFTNMGHIRKKEKKYDEAIERYKKAQEILLKAFGDKHPSVAAVMKDIADVHIIREENSLALPMLTASLAIFTQTLSENHPSVVATYESIGNISYGAKEYFESLKMFTKTLEIRRRTLGYDHPDVATSLENIGRANYSLQCDAQCLEYFQEAAKIRKTTKTIMSLTDMNQIITLGKMMRKNHLHEPVIQLYKTMVERYIVSSTFEGWNTWAALKMLDSFLKEQKLYHEGVDYWTKIKETMSEQLGWIHDRTLVACEYLSIHYKLAGIIKEPYEFTRYREFIQKHIEDITDETILDRDQIIANLFKIVFMSRNDESKAQAASNAITLLNYMNVSFNGMDLTNIKIPHANLTRSIIHKADLSGADLEGVNFTNTYLGNCIFNFANMKGVEFGIPHAEIVGHTDIVRCIAELKGPDGQCWVVSGSSDNTVRVWDLLTKREVRNFRGHSDYVNMVCPVDGPNGETLVASASRDNTVRIWNVMTGKEVRVLKGHNDYVNSVCTIQGPKGENWLASGSRDATIRLWDANTGNQVKVLQGHVGFVYYLGWIRGANGENWLASGGADKTIRIWDINTGSMLKVLNKFSGAVTLFAVTKGQKGEALLAFPMNDMTIGIWNPITQNEPDLLPLTEPGARGICGIDGPNGERWLAFASHDFSIRLWDLVNGDQTKKLEGNTKPMSRMRTGTGPNGEVWLLSITDDKPIRVWDVEIGRKIKNRQPKLATGVEVQKLEGGEIMCRGVLNLSESNKKILLSKGAAFFDEDFVKFCEKGKHSKFQSNKVAECYERGLGVVINMKKAAEWYAKTENFEELKRLAQENSQDAFNTLKDFAEMRDWGNPKYPKAGAIVSECYRHGWGVEKDTKKADKWKK